MRRPRMRLCTSCMSPGFCFVRVTRETLNPRKLRDVARASCAAARRAAQKRVPASTKRTARARRARSRTGRQTPAARAWASRLPSARLRRAPAPVEGRARAPWRHERCQPVGRRIAGNERPRIGGGERRGTGRPPHALPCACASSVVARANVFRSRRRRVVARRCRMAHRARRCVRVVRCPTLSVTGVSAVVALVRVDV